MSEAKHGKWITDRPPTIDEVGDKEPQPVALKVMVS